MKKAVETVWVKVTTSLNLGGKKMWGKNICIEIIKTR